MGVAGWVSVGEWVLLGGCVGWMREVDAWVGYVVVGIEALTKRIFYHFIETIKALELSFLSQIIYKNKLIKSISTEKCRCRCQFTHFQPTNAFKTTHKISKALKSK